MAKAGPTPKPAIMNADQKAEFKTLRRKVQEARTPASYNNRLAAMRTFLLSIPGFNTANCSWFKNG